MLLISIQNVSDNFSVHVTPCRQPQGFPSEIQLETRPFENYARDIQIPSILVATPKSAQDVLLIANWAYKVGYRVRAMGGKHNFSPFLVSQSDAGLPCPNIILVDTTAHLKSMEMNTHDTSPMYSVVVETGAFLLNLLKFLERNGFGLFASPAIPSISVGGLLATGTHGTGAPGGQLDSKSPGHTGGSLSNLIVEMTIVAWNETDQSYVLKTIHRSEKDCKAFLVHLGRTIVTSVTLRVGRNQNLRTKSDFYISSAEFYGHPDEVLPSSRTLSKYVSKYGRVDAVSLPTAKFVWVMAWHEQIHRPSTSRPVFFPFNYYFMDYVPSVFDHVARFFVTRISSIATLIGSVGYIASWLGVLSTWSGDYWGLSKNHLIYTSSYTPHLSIAAFSVLTTRDNLQEVVWKTKSNYDQLEEEYGRDLVYPITGGMDFRITGVDDPNDVGIEGAESPSLSTARMSETHPEYDTVVWLDIASFLGSPKRVEFLLKLQNTLYQDIHDRIGIIRPEWSKEWAFTNDGPFSNETVTRLFSRTYSLKEDDGWDWAIRTFDRYDPFKMFSNEFLDKLLTVVSPK
jgi:hypothetical protein